MKKIRDQRCLNDTKHPENQLSSADAVDHVAAPPCKITRLVGKFIIDGFYVLKL
jgi:hypothetical protein